MLHLCIILLPEDTPPPPHLPQRWRPHTGVRRSTPHWRSPHAPGSQSGSLGTPPYLKGKGKTLPKARVKFVTMTSSILVGKVAMVKQ